MNSIRPVCQMGQKADTGKDGAGWGEKTGKIRS